MNKLRKFPKLLQLYDNIMKDQEKRGFIERVSDDAAKDVHYLPHHPVKKDSVTTPIRIVYNCSCWESGKSASLNDCLTVGPPFYVLSYCGFVSMPLLYPQTSKRHFSMSSYTHQIETLLDFCGHLENNDIQFQTHRFAVVPFGASSSPFMLGAVLDLHLSKSPLQVAADMRNNIYVDNILSRCSTEEELMSYYS